MPRATTCLHNENLITIEEALQLRYENSTEGEFLCKECQRPVRPHREGGQSGAHFEHLERNPSCTLSDPLR